MHHLHRVSPEIATFGQNIQSIPPPRVGQTLANVCQVRAGGGLPPCRSTSDVGFSIDPHAELGWFCRMPSCLQFHCTFE